MESDLEVHHDARQRPEELHPARAGDAVTANSRVLGAPGAGTHAAWRSRCEFTRQVTSTVVNFPPAPRPPHFGNERAGGRRAGARKPFHLVRAYSRETGRGKSRKWGGCHPAAGAGCGTRSTRPARGGDNGSKFTLCARRRARVRAAAAAGGGGGGCRASTPPRLSSTCRGATQPNNFMHGATQPNNFMHVCACTYMCDSGGSVRRPARL